MPKIMTIHCDNCNKSFDFEHPSVNKVRDLLGVTLDCPHCSVTLTAPDDEIHMGPIELLVMKRAREMGAGSEGQVGYIDL